MVRSSVLPNLNFTRGELENSKAVVLLYGTFTERKIKFKKAILKCR